jgi:hypothetical protein
VRLRLAFDILIRGIVPADAGHLGHQITSLDEEFADIFLSGKTKFMDRLRELSCPDLDLCFNSSYHSSHKRFNALRHTTVMPSVAIAALVREFGVSRNQLHLIDFLRNRRRFGAVAHTVGESVGFLRICCKTEADLDKCWHEVRNELLNIRVAFAQSDGELFDSNGGRA